MNFEMINGTKHFAIRACQAKAFTKLVDKINRLGGQATYIMGEAKWVDHPRQYRPQHWGEKIAVREVQYTGPVSMRGEGVRPIVTVDWKYGRKVSKVFASAPDDTRWFMEHYKNHEGLEQERCDICNKSRRRNKTVIFREDNCQGDSRPMQVGSECATKILGKNFENMLAQLEVLWQCLEIDRKALLEDEQGYPLGAPSGKGSWAINYALKACQHVIDTHGFVSAMQVSYDHLNPPTGERVKALLLAVRKDDELRREVEATSIEGLDRLDILEQQAKGGSGFWVRAWSLWQVATVEDSDINTLAAAVHTLRKLLAPKPVKPAGKQPQWVAAEGERVTKNLTVVFVKETEDYRIYKFEDEEGNIYSTFGKVPGMPGRGETKDYTFRIKKHDQYAGEKQNKITHLKEA
jgi:hypothetical protein